MALISQTGSSNCFRLEIVQSKFGQNVVFNMVSNVEAYKMKGNSVGFSSLSRNSAKMAHILRINCAGAGWKRGHRVIVGASPPTEDAVVVTEPLTKKDLVDYLASGCKSKEKWRYKSLNHDV